MNLAPGGTIVLVSVTVFLAAIITRDLNKRTMTGEQTEENTKPSITVRSPLTDIRTIVHL